MKILVLMLLSSSFVYPFAYDSAIAKAQKGNWQDAHNALSSIIIDNPDRADVVYDAGVAAYNLGNRCHAATCFARAAECSADKNVTFCAHFNAGNVYVDEKKLERALEEYDKALAIEPENEYARHNRDRVAEMLNEQQQNKDQQQDQQNKDDEQNQDDNQDKQQDQDNKQDQKQNGNDQESSNGNDKQDGQQGQNGNDKQNQKNDSSNNESSQDESLDQQSQGDREQQADAAKQCAEHGNNPKDKHHNTGNDKQRNGNNELEKKAQDAQKEGHEQQGDKHNTTPEQENIREHNKSNGSDGSGQEEQLPQGDALDKIALNDPWLLKILDNQEMHDKAVNKQLMEAKIRQHGGKNGQNCW